MCVKYSVKLYLLGEGAVRVHEPKSSRPAVSISLRAVWNLAKVPRLNPPCRRTHLGDKSQVIIRICVCGRGRAHMLDVLGSGSGTVQVPTSNSWMKKTTLEESGGLIWRALCVPLAHSPACCPTRERTHTSAPSLVSAAQTSG